MALDTQESIFTELADFIVSQPSLDDLAAFKVSAGVQAHLERLLEKNREGIISAEERLELEKMLAVSHVMTLVKTQAKLKLAKLTTPPA